MCGCVQVADALSEVVSLIVAELGPVLAEEAPKPAPVEETPEDAAFMSSERKLKLSGAVAALQAVVSAGDWDALTAAVQGLVHFANDPTTTFLLDYDDIKKHVIAA